MHSFWKLKVAALLIASTSLATAETPTAPSSDGAAPRSAPSQSTALITSSSSGTKSSERLREGTRLSDVPGTFQSVGGDSISFSPGNGSKDSYKVLANLALERISRTLDENRGAKQWIVSGVITEFRGANYLLVTKAVVPSQDGDAGAGR
jgi:hypothetical protein